MADSEEDSQLIDRYREIVNFNYWRLRCQFEQTPAALAARELVYKGDLALAAADLNSAKDFYRRGFVEWRKVFNEFPEVINEGTTGEEIVETVKKYRGILHELDEEIPQDFILREVIEKNDRMNELKSLFRPLPRTPGSRVPPNRPIPRLPADRLPLNRTLPPSATPPAGEVPAAPSAPAAEEGKTPQPEENAAPPADKAGDVKTGEQQGGEAKPEAANEAPAASDDAAETPKTPQAEEDAPSPADEAKPS